MAGAGGGFGLCFRAKAGSEQQVNSKSSARDAPANLLLGISTPWDKDLPSLWRV
jgi:hypothetical protein